MPELQLLDLMRAHGAATTLGGWLAHEDILAIIAALEDRERLRAAAGIVAATTSAVSRGDDCDDEASYVLVAYMVLPAHMDALRAALEHRDG